MKLVLKVLSLAVLMVFFSCKSSDLGIPGERDYKQHSLYVQYFNLAEEYMSLKNYNKAIEYYEMALPDKELEQAVFYKLGQVYTYTQNYSKALEIYEELIKKDSQNISFKICLAYLYAMTDQQEKSLALYSKLFESNQSNADVLVNYINVLIYIKDYENAGSYLKVLTEKFPDNKNIEPLREEIQKYEQSQIQNTENQ